MQYPSQSFGVSLERKLVSSVLRILNMQSTVSSLRVSRFDGKSVAERALGFGSGTGCGEGAFGLRNWSDLRTGGLELEPDRLHVNKQARSSKLIMVKKEVSIQMVVASLVQVTSTQVHVHLSILKGKDTEFVYQKDRYLYVREFK
ncbi:hypothetical protein Tco_0190619 [Tanacetum coccineum]